MPGVPTPSIYLCNRFSLQSALNTEFFAGKEQLIRSTTQRMKLLAACGERGIKLGQNLPEPALKGMHVWELDSWPALYEIMYELSEAKWYRALGETLHSEYQHLLVNFASGYGIAQRTPWQSDTTAGYRYLHEELTLARGTTMHGYLRELNWFAAELSRFGFSRIWCARHITGRPGQICLLWQVPDRIDIEESLDRIAAGPNGARYAAMMRSVSELTRAVMQPMYSERLDERVRAGEAAPIIHSNLGPTRGQAGAFEPASLATSLGN
jgi:hypothetical protein